VEMQHLDVMFTVTGRACRCSRVRILANSKIIAKPNTESASVPEWYRCLWTITLDCIRLVLQ